MDNIIMAAKVCARQIAPQASESELMALEQAWHDGHVAGMMLARATRDLQLDASRAHVARLERQLANQMTGAA
jgi:hypothetical protein